MAKILELSDDDFDAIMIKIALGTHLKQVKKYTASAKK